MAMACVACAGWLNTITLVRASCLVMAMEPQVMEPGWNSGIMESIATLLPMMLSCSFVTCGPAAVLGSQSHATEIPRLLLPAEASTSQGMLSTRYPHTSASGEAGPWMRQQHVESVIGLHPQVRAVTCIILLWPLQLLPCSQLTPPL